MNGETRPFAGGDVCQDLKRTPTTTSKPHHRENESSKHKGRGAHIQPMSSRTDPEPLTRGKNGW